MIIFSKKSHTQKYIITFEGSTTNGTVRLSSGFDYNDITLDNPEFSTLRADATASSRSKRSDVLENPDFLDYDPTDDNVST